MSTFANKAHLDEMGFVVISSNKLISQVREIKTIFLNEYFPRMSQVSRQINCELIKRFTDHPAVASLYCTDDFVNILTKQLDFDVPVKCGPTVSHYTSYDITGNGYGLPYHQDYPSMASSKLSIICWLSLVESNPESHGIELIPSAHKGGLMPGAQTDKGYILDENIDKTGSSVIPTIKAGELLVMSSFTPHRTFVNSDFDGFKLSVSQRFDDLSDPDWAARGYKNAYVIKVDREMFKN